MAILQGRLEPSKADLGNSCRFVTARSSVVRCGSASRILQYWDPGATSGWRNKLLHHSFQWCPDQRLSTVNVSRRTHSRASVANIYSVHWSIIESERNHFLFYQEQQR